MKKLMYMLMIVLGISLLAVGVFSLNTSARETELFMELALDLDDQDYDENTYRMRRLRGNRGPLLFIGLGESIKEDILEQATLLDIEVDQYILAITVSTYDATYEFDTVVQTIKNLSDEDLDVYLNTLKQVLIDANENIKTTLDGLKEAYMPQIQAVKDEYQDDVKTLIQNIKASDEASRQGYIDQLERIKLEIQAKVADIQEAFLVDLENEGIAIEGLYGLFIQRSHDRFEERMDMLEKRNPKLYDRIKHHFNK